MTVVDRWQRLVTRCRLQNVTLLVHPMTDRHRALERDGVTVLMLKHGLPLGERCDEVERWLFARQLSRLPIAG